jgi:hypothetical protein
MGSDLGGPLELLTAPVRPNRSLRLELASLHDVHAKGYVLHPTTPTAAATLGQVRVVS